MQLLTFNIKHNMLHHSAVSSPSLPPGPNVAPFETICTKYTGQKVLPGNTFASASHPCSQSPQTSKQPLPRKKRKEPNFWKRQTGLTACFPWEEGLEHPHGFNRAASAGCFSGVCREGKLFQRNTEDFGSPQPSAARGKMWPLSSHLCLFLQSGLFWKL